MITETLVDGKHGPLSTSKLNCILDYGNKHNIQGERE